MGTVGRLLLQDPNFAHYRYYNWLIFAILIAYPRYEILRNARPPETDFSRLKPDFDILPD